MLRKSSGKQSQRFRDKKTFGVESECAAMTAALENNAQQFKGLDDRIEIFRAGEHTDSQGNKRVWTAGHLQEMVDTFSADDPFPHVLGHPEHDDPAYGWGASLSVEDDKLYLDESKDLNSDFVDMVDSGAFRNRSISVVKNDDGQFKIAHLGWLGAKAPAIKGMKPLEYNADDSAVVYEFSVDDRKLERAVSSVSWSLHGIYDMLRSTKNRLIESIGLEKADEEMPEYRLDAIKQGAEKSNDIREDDRSALYAQDDEDNLQIEDTTMSGDKPKAQDDSVDANFSQADLDKAAKDAEAKATAKFARQNECNEFVRSLDDSGKVTPAMKVGLSDFLQGLNNEQTFSFSDGAGDDAETTITPFEFAKNFFNSLPDNFSALTSEMVTDDNAPEAGESKNIGQRAQDYMTSEAAAGRTISIAEAVDHVTQEEK